MLFVKPESVSWLPLGGRRFKGKVICLWNLSEVWGHRLDKTWQKSYWVIWKFAHVNRQTLGILFSRNRFLDSSTRGRGRQRSFAFCPLERRLGGGSTTQTGHLRFMSFELYIKSFWPQELLLLFLAKASRFSPGRARVGCWAQSWFSDEGWCPSSLETPPQEAGERVSFWARRRARRWSRADTS